MQFGSKGTRALIAGLTVGLLSLSACSAGSLGSSSASGSAAGGGAKEPVTITFFVDNSEQSVKSSGAMADGFNASQKDVVVKVDASRPGGADGDNLIKTRLATGDMPDVFQYNSGSLFPALDPAKNLQPIDDSTASKLDDSFKTAVSSGGKVYGVPFGQQMAGGILYNKAVFAKAGVSVPKTWAEFMANNAKIKASGVDPVIATYGDTWTSQLFVLADFANVSAQQPDWADKYTKNQAHYVDEPALTSFKRLEDVSKAGYLNKDFAAAKFNDGLSKLVKGQGAQYPMLTFAVSALTGLDPKAAENIGFFAQPGNDADKTRLTAWTPAGIYIPATTKGDKLEAVKKFMAYIASPEACDYQSSKVTPTGPYAVKGSKLPSGLPAAVNDLQAYFDSGKASPALEFISPIKGPNLEKITVEVGSGIRSAADGAKLYDQDVKKQAQQLGLPGW